MHRTISPQFIVYLGMTLAAVAAQAAGTVQVSFVQPEQFADVRDANQRSDDNLRELKGFLEARAARHLGDGQALSIEILDVNLAGEIRYSRRLGRDVRVLRSGADWPRITLRYKLESPGQAPRSGEETVADMSYLSHLPRYADGDALRYEKHMLDDWLDAQFGHAAAK